MLNEKYVFYAFIHFSLSIWYLQLNKNCNTEKKTQKLKINHFIFSVQKCIPGHLHTFSEILYDKYWPVKLKSFSNTRILELSTVHLLVRKVNGDRSCRCLNRLCHTNYHPWTQAICQAWDTLKKERENINAFSFVVVEISEKRVAHKTYQD